MNSRENVNPTSSTLPDQVSAATAPFLTPGAPVSRNMHWLALGGFFLACVVAFSFGFTPLRTSQDEFWHLKTGQWIVAHGSIPKSEIFTYTAAHLPWHNHEWLTQVLMWKLYALAGGGETTGWQMIIFVKSLLIVLAYAGFGMLLALRMRQPVWAALAAALATALARRTFYPRPPVVTYLFLALLFWVLIEWRSGRLRERWLWFLVPFFALWSNLHGGWLAGLVLAGAFWADAVVTAIQCRHSPPFRDQALRRLLHLTLLGAACVLATMANPSGYHLYELPLNVGKDKYLAPRIGEMLPTNWNYVWVMDGIIAALALGAVRPVRLKGGLGALVLLAVILSLLKWARAFLPLYQDPTLSALKTSAWIYTAVALPVFVAAAWRVRPAGWFAHVLIGCFFLEQGLHHVRHLTLTAIAVLPVMAWSLEGWAETWCQQGSNARRGRVASYASFGLLAILSAFWLFANASSFSAFRAIKLLAFLARQESYSFAQRNAMLMSGMVMQRSMLDNSKPNWPVPSSLPQGLFMVDAYPVKTVDFLLDARLPGPIWNDGNHAGYLIWRVAPEKYKVFTDNRYDIYGGLVIREEHSVSNGYDLKILDYIRKQAPNHFEGPPPQPWDKVLDKWGIQTVLMPADADGNIPLNASGAWVRVWEDFDFNIWVRDTPANKEAIERAKALPHYISARPVRYP